MKKHAAIIIVAFSCFFGIVNSANSAGGVLLHIDGIEGESTVEGHEKWIDLLTWSWELSASISNTGGGRVGKPHVGPIIVTKYIDKASPFLNLCVLNGRHLKQVDLILRRSGESALEYLHIKMSDVQVINVSHGGMANDYRFTESVSFEFDKVCYSYTPQKDDGSGDAEIIKCFDILRNRTF